MKKLIIIIFTLFFIANFSYGQKFAYVDTDYILNKIPEFKQAQEKLDFMSQEWQVEIEAKYSDVDKMYRSYQKEQLLLTEDMKIKREEAIMQKENQAKELQKKIFLPRWRIIISSPRASSTNSRKNL